MANTSNLSQSEGKLRAGRLKPENPEKLNVQVPNSYKIQDVCVFK